MRVFLKKLASGLLPSGLLYIVKRNYYAGIVGNFWEPEIDVVSPLLTSGDVVVDIGANVGWYTIFLSRKVGPQGKVYSIEPIQESFQLLSALVKHYSCTNTVLHNCAVSDREAELKMIVPLNDQGVTNYYRAHITQDFNSGQKAAGIKRVISHTLDQLMGNDLDRVKFIKCDVEGHEDAVLNGSLQVLQRSAPACLIEIATSPSQTSEVFNKMFTRGYRAFWYNAENRKLIEEINHKVVNYFFLRDEHIIKIRQSGLDI